GQAHEAAVWDRFGYLRLMEDMAYASAINGRGTHMTLMLALSYRTDEGDALRARIAALPLAERVQILAEAERMDDATPRLYPDDWGRNGRDPYEVDWTAAPAVWNDETKANHASLIAQTRREMREAEEAGVLSADPPQ